MGKDHKVLQQDKLIELMQFSDHQEVAEQALELIPDEPTPTHVEQMGDLVMHFSQVMHTETETRQARWHANKVMRHLGTSAINSGDITTAEHIRKDMLKRSGIAPKISAFMLELSILKHRLLT